MPQTPIVQTDQNGLVRLPGGTFRGEESGGLVYSENFYVDPSLISQLDNIIPKVGITKHPEDTGATCSGVTGRRDADGGYYLQVQYTEPGDGGFITIGSSNADGVIEFNGSTSAEPIESHPSFATMAGTAAAPLNDAVFDEDELFVGWKPSSQFAGVDSYLVPSIVGRYSYPSNSKPSSALIGNIGEIVSPPSDFVTPGGRDWLLVNVTYRSLNGGDWSITEEYQLSGPGGWNSTIY